MSLPLSDRLSPDVALGHCHAADPARPLDTAMQEEVRVLLVDTATKDLFGKMHSEVIPHHQSVFVTGFSCYRAHTLQMLLHNDTFQCKRCHQPFFSLSDISGQTGLSKSIRGKAGAHTADKYVRQWLTCRLFRLITVSLSLSAHSYKHVQKQPEVFLEIQSMF